MAASVEETEVAVEVDEGNGKPPSAPGTTGDFARVAEVAAQRIRSDSRLRRNLPADGRIEIDRALPFLFVFRRREGVSDPGAEHLLTGFSSYLLTGHDESLEEGLGLLVRSVVRAAREKMGDFLLFEVWIAENGPDDSGCEPSMTVVVEPGAPDELAGILEAKLGELRITPRSGGSLGCSPVFETLEVRQGRVAPPDMDPLPVVDDGSEDDRNGSTYRVGLEISPFFRDRVSGDPYPRLLQFFRTALVNSMEDVLFEFALDHTSLDPPHPRALARRTVGRAGRHVDRRLGEVARSFDTLFQVTPINSREAWDRFKEGGFEEAPDLRYRPLRFDPESLKRRLFHVPIEKVEDPLLGFLFREKQEELDREITMVRELGTARFRHASVQLYGGVDDELHHLALEILEAVPPFRDGDSEEYGEEDDPGSGWVGAEEFAAAARKEIAWYRQQSPAFEGGVEIRDDLVAGLMVAQGVLCVGKGLRIPRNRVDALIHHEVGTHLVTWCNGANQSIQQFQTGLAGYDPLQEGLAVLAEYLVGGLTTGRLRVLAGRVLGVRSLLDGADFLETFRLLRNDHDFMPRTAFIITVRIHRGGGLTKDAAYLRGLRDLLSYLRVDGALDPLFVGKLGLSHTEIVQELVLRGVLTLPLVKPRYMSDLAAMERLGACRRMTVMDLVERTSASS